MRTIFMLMAQYNAAAVPLEKVAEDYLGLTPGYANKLASAGQLELPVFRTQNSQKSPWLVSIEDLAEFLDKRRREATA